MTEEERKRFYAKISRLDFAGPDRWETWDLGEGMTKAQGSPGAGHLRRQRAERLLNLVRVYDESAICSHFH